MTDRRKKMNRRRAKSPSPVVWDHKRWQRLGVDEIRELDLRLQAAAHFIVRSGPIGELLLDADDIKQETWCRLIARVTNRRLEGLRYPNRYARLAMRSVVANAVRDACHRESARIAFAHLMTTAIPWDAAE